MNVFIAIILGAVQGLTEFLPVSSSGHLVLLQKIFGITEGALFFSIMLHVGTLIAVITVLWWDIWAILRRIIQPLTLYVIIATLPLVIVAIFLRGFIENAFESGEFLGFAFLITTILLVSAELLSRHAKNRVIGSVVKSYSKMDSITMSWRNALFIGIMQAVAVIPGVSRSGATISGALFCKLNRDFAARFAFLLSIPAILGALVLEIRNMLKGVEPVGLEETGIIAIIAGTLTAALVGFFAVKFMIKIIREKSLFGFAIYTGILGVLVLIDQYITNIIF